MTANPPANLAGAPEAQASEFAHAFGEAVTASGLSLDAIRRALADRGHQLSVATLSYWRSGRRRPERASSLAALETLEEILDLTPGALMGLLPGRVVPATYDLDGLYELNGANRVMAQLVERLGLTYDDGLERLSHQDLVELDATGRQVRNRLRMLVRSLRDGTQRFPISFWPEEEAADGVPYTPPTVKPLMGCTLGRSIVSPDDRLLMMEAVLDHPLDEGECLLIEFECTPGARPAVSNRWERGVLRPLPLYLVSVTFHPDRMPTTVERFERPIRSEVPKSTPVLVTSPCVTVLFSDVVPGVAGLVWRW
ncbi:MAG: hypothetical protein IPK37_07620 [Austwickia sp.]|nr:MAG: hypothetical protein IPK37_07620 [Austwickia sp.]